MSIPALRTIIADPASMSRKLPILLLSAVFLPNVASANPVSVEPLAGAPYSAWAKIPPHATKAFTGTYTGEGVDLTSQAADALGKLEDDLIAAGLAMEDVINVRGYLKVDPEDPASMSRAMTSWNDAFVPAFSGRVYPPTRTTLGVDALIEPDALVAVEAVVAVDAPPAGLAGTAANPRLSRIEGVHETIALVHSFTPIAFTSGNLADPLEPDGTDFGTMAQQTKSTLEKLEAILATWGLTPFDVVYVRAMLSPRVGSDYIDFGGYSTAYELFWRERGVEEPPVGVFAAPGFNATGRHIEIEFYAAFPDAATHLFSGEYAGVRSRREGSETSFLNRSVVTARDATLVWFAGVIGPGREDHEGQGVDALMNLRERMDAAGIDFPDIVQLRAYLDLEEFRPDFGSWNRAYLRFFHLPSLNAKKPVRTAFPVTLLPGPSLLEIEAIGAY